MEGPPGIPGWIQEGSREWQKDRQLWAEAGPGSVSHRPVAPENKAGPGGWGRQRGWRGTDSTPSLEDRIAGATVAICLWLQPKPGGPQLQFLHCTVKLLHYSARGNPAQEGLLCRGLTELTERSCETAGKGGGSWGLARAAPQSHSPPQRSHQTDAFQEEYPNVKLPSRVPKIPNLYLYLIQGKAQRSAPTAWG